MIVATDDGLCVDYGLQRVRAFMDMDCLADTQLHRDAYRSSSDRVWSTRPIMHRFTGKTFFSIS